MARDSGSAPVKKKDIPRQEMPSLDLAERRRGFAEVTLGFSLEQAQREAFRCILCKNARCVQACPLQNDIPQYLKAMAEGRLEEALFRESLPLSAICGRVCYHPCEAACVVGIKREPVAINALERFAADFSDVHPPEGLAPVTPWRDARVAVVGSGPAGLVCAYDLALLGYRVTLFEEAPVAGGMLHLGIPEYRLPREVIARAVSSLKRVGVEFVLGTAIGRDVSLEELQKEYRAIFLAVGAHRGKKLGLPPGETLTGVLDAVVFLRRVNLGDHTPPGEKVVVIGGGDSAIDAARVALRLGSEVTLLYRRSRSEMPANPDEVHDAEREGVRCLFLAAPVEIQGREGKVTGVRCVRMELKEPDSSGRPRPVPLPGFEFSLEVDCVLSAIGQGPDLSCLSGVESVATTPGGTVLVNLETLETDSLGIFAGGDVVTGPQTVTEAMAMGRRAARAIHRYLERQAEEDQNVSDPVRLAGHQHA